MWWSNIPLGLTQELEGYIYSGESLTRPSVSLRLNCFFLFFFFFELFERADRELERCRRQPGEAMAHYFAEMRRLKAQSSRVESSLYAKTMAGPSGHRREKEINL